MSSSLALGWRRVLGWRPKSDEALLFIHGWTSGHKNAHHSLGQFLNLSRLPAHVKSFCFAWPCGQTVLSFPTVAKFASTNTEVHSEARGARTRQVGEVRNVEA